VGIDYIRDFPEYGPEPEPERPKRFFVLGRTADIPAGKIRRYVVSGLPVAVFNVEGRLVACRDRCPHMGADLSMGRLDGDFVICSWHGWTFNLTDGRCRFKDWACLELYPVRLRDGFFEVELPVGA